MTPTLADQYAAALPGAPHLAAVRLAVEKYGEKSVVTHVNQTETYLAAAAGLPPASTLFSVSDAVLPWWAQALGELGRRFRPRVDVPECDVLVWTGEERADVVYDVLVGVATRVRRAVVLTGVGLYAEIGPDGRPGLLPGVRRFLRTDPTWVVADYRPDGYGAIVLSRDPDDHEPVKHGVRDAFRFFRAELARRAAGGVYLPLPMAQPRIDACLTCVHRGGAEGGNCKVCHCHLFQVPESSPVRPGSPGKVFFPGQACPVGKWGEDREGGRTMTPIEVEVMLTQAFQPETATPPAGQTGA